MAAGEWDALGMPGSRCFAFDPFGDGQQCEERIGGGGAGIPMWQPTKYFRDGAGAGWGSKLETYTWSAWGDTCYGPGMQFGKEDKPWREANNVISEIPIYDFDGYRAWFEQAQARNPWPSSKLPIVWLDPSGTFSASKTQLIKTQNVYDMLIKPFIERVRDRQRAALDTLQCAYVSHRAPAFREGPWAAELLQKLKDRREQLLSHEARFKIHMADVTDNVGVPGITGNFAQMLKEAGSMGVGSLGPGTSEEPDLAGGVVELYTPQEPPEPPTEEPGDMPANMPTDEPASDSEESMPDAGTGPTVPPAVVGAGALALGLAIFGKR